MPSFDNLSENTMNQLYDFTDVLLGLINQMNAFESAHEKKNQFFLILEYISINKNLLNYMNKFKQIVRFKILEVYQLHHFSELRSFYQQIFGESIVHHFT
jgi:hypothetical protein